ncbi:MAG: DUF1643 domain-containing protein [Cyanobacteria bacterium J06649_4]
MKRTAVFDRTGRHRYRLDRQWKQARGQTGGQEKDQKDTNTGQAVAFVMLNPSAADHTKDDPTLRACIQFAQRWAYSSLSVVNLFSYRTAHPQELRKVKRPVGKENDSHLIQAVTAADKVVLAWGNWGELHGRDRTILQLLTPHAHKLYCLRRNQSGQPCHPLYIRRDTPLQPFTLTD